MVIGVRLGRVRVFGCRTDEASRFEGLVDGDDRDVSQRYASPTLRAPLGEGGGGETKTSRDKQTYKGGVGSSIFTYYYNVREDADLEYTRGSE